MGDLGLFKQPSSTSPMELRVEDGKVEIIFRASTKWVKLTPEQAESIGYKLIEFSRTASGKIIVPGISSS